MRPLGCAGTRAGTLTPPLRGHSPSRPFSGKVGGIDDDAACQPPRGGKDVAKTNFEFQKRQRELEKKRKKEEKKLRKQERTPEEAAAATAEPEAEVKPVA